MSVNQTKQKNAKSSVPASSLSSISSWEKFHVAMLVAIPALYALLISLTGEGDGLTKKVKIFSFVTGVTWSTYLAVTALGTSSDPKAIAAAVGLRYRALLKHRSLFSAFNVLLFAVVVGLLDQLLFYRPVHIKGDFDMNLFLNDNPGELDFLLFAKEKEQVTIRLRVGDRRLSYKTMDEKLVGGLPPITVSFWKWDNGHFYIEAKNEDFYHQLR